MTIVLEDFEGNQARDPLVIEVACPTGSVHPICYVEPEIDDTITTIVIDTETTTSAPSLSDTITSSTRLEFFDYEEAPAQSLSDTVEAIDLSLEDDPDFVDEPGIVTTEQAAEIIEEIETALEGEIEFDETSIPQGDVTEITPELEATLTVGQIRAIEVKNDYAVALNEATFNRRL